MKYFAIKKIKTIKKDYKDYKEYKKKKKSADEIKLSYMSQAEMTLEWEYFWYIR